MNRDNQILLVTHWLHSLKNDHIFSGNWSREAIAKGENILQNYWLEDDEYNSKWLSLEREFFVENTMPPDYVFKKDVRVFGIDLTGLPFFEEEYSFFQKFLKAANEKNFVIIENASYNSTNINNPRRVQDKEREPRLKFKFPADISFEELQSGGIVSDIIINGEYSKDYYIFGESALWGKYAATLNYDTYFWGYDESISQQMAIYQSAFKKEINELTEKVKTGIQKHYGFYYGLKDYFPNILK